MHCVEGLGMAKLSVLPAGDDLFQVYDVLVKSTSAASGNNEVSSMKVLCDEVPDKSKAVGPAIGEEIR